MKTFEIMRSYAKWSVYQGVVVMLGLMALCSIGSADTPSLTWDPATVQFITAGGYARITRTGTTDLICVYSRARGVRYRWSRDDANSWGPEQTLAASATHTLTNAEIIKLHNGDLLYAYNARVKDDQRATRRVRRFEIRLKRSSDNGDTWGPEQVLYQAGTQFENGCWEPMVVQLPDGECQLFFANEGPYTASNEQEISMLRSLDNGQTWSTATTVSFAPGRRDGMPVATVLHDNQTLVVAIEDGSYPGPFKPTICSTPIIDSWRQTPLYPGAKDRWRALAPGHRIPDQAVYSAPYIVTLPDGGTLLSGQSTAWMDSPNADVANIRMAVCVGDASARNFKGLTWPFLFGDYHRQNFWNSLFVKDARTVIAISEIIRGPNGTGIYTIEGKVHYGEPERPAR